MELLSEYGLFLAKIVTVVLAIAAIAAIIVNVAQRNKRQRGELQVNNLSEQYKEMKEELAAALMDTHQQRLRVNCINPGGTRTAMRASAFPTEDPQKLKTPADIMPLYLWLMGDDSRRKTGMTFDAQPGRKPGISQ